jgi:hypothetical protein
MGAPFQPRLGKDLREAHEASVMRDSAARKLHAEKCQSDIVHLYRKPGVPPHLSSARV